MNNVTYENRTDGSFEMVGVADSKSYDQVCAPSQTKSIADSARKSYDLPGVQ